MDDGHDDHLGALSRRYGGALADIRRRLAIEVAGCPDAERVAPFVTAGKGLRPLLLLVTAAATGPPPSDDGGRAPTAGALCQAVLAPAVALELVHAASLVHDDIIDRSPHRRGGPALHVLIGESCAVVVADWLLLRAFDVLTRDDARCGGAVSTAALLARYAQECCTGQLRELAGREARASTEHDYLTVARGKTGAAFAAAAVLGATAVRAEDPVTEAFERLGYALGTAYQVADDLIDHDGPLGQIPPDRLRRLGREALASAYHALDRLDGADGLSSLELRALTAAVARPLS